MFISEQQEKFPTILTDAQLRDNVVELLTLALLSISHIFLKIAVMQALMG